MALTSDISPAPVVEPVLYRGPAVRLEGGLLGPDFLERLATGDLPGQRPRDFGLPSGRSLIDEIAATYRDARDLWHVFRRRLERLEEKDPATSLTRDMWVIPFLRLLGYELHYNRKSYEAKDMRFGISHRAGRAADAPPVHIVGIRRSLDRVDPGGRPRISPHALLQQFLNHSDHLWGIVTNGRILRLLRKSPMVRRQAYVEFDLETILEDERFNEFALLFRLLHRSRLPQGIADASECLLERYYQDALEQGNRARDRLRGGVEICLQILGTGFLRRWQGVLPTADDLHEQLLQLVYRFLFLLVAEERELLGGTDLYRRHYSISRLRHLVDRREAYTDHEDLWLSLRVLWHLLRDATPFQQINNRPLADLLELPVLDGNLFDPAPLEEQTITNRELLQAFYHLVYYYDEDAKITRRVNYAALDVEELGSVYESLLDNHPVITEDYDGRRFGFATGTERKSTGSYYTPHELVAELIRSALEPVLEERLRDARTKEEKERAILSLRVIDPACGSGHFLLAAARRLGLELARVRTDEEEPPPEARREATREAIAHCIYGVDKNPLAVDLCRVALWIEACVPDKPLTFLNHHIRCGDSLVGVFDLKVLEEGIPDEAFERGQADKSTKAISRALIRRNREERRGQLVLELNVAGETLEEDLLRLAGKMEELEQIPDDTVAQVHEKRRRYNQLQQQLQRERLACDLWTAAFFWDFASGEDAPTTELVRRALRNPAALPGPLVGKALALAQQHRFFHWPLEFPEVFVGGGFDVVLGNPPWDQVQLDDREFFAVTRPDIASAPNMAARKKMISKLMEEDPELYLRYKNAIHQIQSIQRFIHNSGRYPLTSYGRLNLAPLFAETARQLVKSTGRVGMIVPTGIATDAFNQHFFRDVVEQGELVSLFDFENRKGIFPAVHRSYKFCLLTLRRAPKGRARISMEFAFFCHDVRDLQDPERRFTLTPEDFRLINPNTGTAPIFRSRRDAELTKHIYRQVPVLVNKAMGKAGNPWGFRGLLMFMMNTSSHLFRTREELEEEGWQLEGNIFMRDGERYLPLYEAKMIHQFNHRFGDYRDLPPGSKSTQLPEVPPERLADPDYTVLPRYWVPEEEVEARLQGRWDRGWLLGWRDITNATNERTVIAAVIPRVGVGDTFLLALPSLTGHVYGLLASLNCLALDFAARQKVGGTHLKFHVFKQLPVLPPAVFEQACPWSPGETLAEWVRPRVLELTYTAWDLEPFARDLGYEGPPFRWDEERRFQLRCELDAAFFILYLGTPEEWDRKALPSLKELFPTPRDAVAYILDQFPIVRRKDEKRYGTYRTKEAILEQYDAMVASIQQNGQ